MPTPQRRERNRADRHQLILRSARELAESEGWDAVTTRRLAERIEYSQPVLYGHFAGKSAIVDAVALEGFAELGTTLTEARTSAAPGSQVAAVARAYVDFATANPAVYEAMFTLSTTFSFGTPDSPPELRRAFAAFADVIAPLAAPDDPETFVETVWAALHGLILLSRGNRLRPAHEDQRLTTLLGLLG